MFLNFSNLFDENRNEENCPNKTIVGGIIFLTLCLHIYDNKIHPLFISDAKPSILIFIKKWQRVFKHNSFEAWKTE